MVFLDCSNASAGTPGAECLRSCHTLDVDCVSRLGGHSLLPRDLPLSLGHPGRRGPRVEADGPPAHSSALTACLAASALRGWCRTGAGAAWRRRTAPACTTRPPTSPGRPSGSTATPGGWRAAEGGMGVPLAGGQAGPRTWGSSGRAVCAPGGARQRAGPVDMVPRRQGLGIRETGVRLGGGGVGSQGLSSALHLAAPQAWGGAVPGPGFVEEGPGPGHCCPGCWGERGVRGWGVVSCPGPRSRASPPLGPQHLQGPPVGMQPPALPGHLCGLRGRPLHHL